MNKKILIAGATGLVGQHLLKLALADERVEQVYTLVRRSQNISHKKLKEIMFNYNDDVAYNNLPQVGAVFCCLGTTIKKAGSQEKFKQVDFDYPLRLAKSIQSLSYNVVTAMGADSKSSIFYNKVKGELEDALKKLTFERLNIFQPSLLLGEREEFRLGEKVAMLIMPKFNFLMLGELKKYRSIKAKDVAKAMLKAALDNNKTKTYTSDEIQTLADSYNGI